MSRSGAACMPAAITWRAGAAALMLVSTFAQAAAQGTLPGGLVYLRDVDPSIVQDIRYAGSNNFVGRSLPGYAAAECVLRRDVAAALARVEADLAASGLGLKVFDCYRPTRAVHAMAQWSADGRDAGASKRFFPRLPKNQLFALGYIAAHSQHSTGTAVDLTLIERARGDTPAFDPTAAYGQCTAPAAQRAPDSSIDMGTGYDCLDVLSHTANPAIGAEQRRWRNILMAAMAKRGFTNYRREWWHFGYGSPTSAASYDVPIRPRAGKPTD